MDRLRRQMAAQPQRIQDLIDDCRLPEHHLVKSGPEFRRIAVPENIPPLLQTWYRSKELYISRADVKYEWAFDEKLPERVWRDYRAMAPLYRLLERLLTMQGYVNLYGVITASNAGSIRLHEKLGYRQTGLHEKTGWKFGQWHDVAWLHKRVREGEPGTILPLSALDPAQVEREIAAAQREIEEKLKM